MSAGLLSVFGLAPALGRDIRADEFGADASRVVVVGHGFRERNFVGDEEVLGRRIALNGVGFDDVVVAPEGFDFPGGTELWIPRRISVEECARGCHTWEGQVYRDQDRPLHVTGGPLLYFVGGANRDELVGTQFRAGAAEAPVHEAVIHGAWHASFGDLLYLYRPYADRDWLERHRREVRAGRVNQITGDYLHEFFSVHLRGAEPDLLWPDSREQLGTTDDRNYPEVEVRTYVR